MKTKTLFFALLMLVSSLIHGQGKNSRFNIGVKAQSGSGFGFFGVEGEYLTNSQNKIMNSLLFSLNSAAMRLKTDYGNTTGTGAEVGVGLRKYLGKTSKTQGLYVDNIFTVGSIQFSDDLKYNNISFPVEGKYTYLSLINTSLGYKLLLNKFLVEPSVSARYNTKLSASGIVGSDVFNVPLYHVGLKLGYSF